VPLDTATPAPAVEVREDRTAAPPGNLTRALAALLITIARRQLADIDRGEAPHTKGQGVSR
jgi:hypothetical protein